MEGTISKFLRNYSWAILLIGGFLLFSSIIIKMAFLPSVVSEEYKQKCRYLDVDIENAPSRLIDIIDTYVINEEIDVSLYLRWRDNPYNCSILDDKIEIYFGKKLNAVYNVSQQKKIPHHITLFAEETEELVDYSVRWEEVIRNDGKIEEIDKREEKKKFHILSPLKAEEKRREWNYQEMMERAALTGAFITNDSLETKTLETLEKQTKYRLIGIIIGIVSFIFGVVRYFNIKIERVRRKPHYIEQKKRFLKKWKL